MPDIAMCRNEKCTDKQECYRYMAKPSEYQSFSSFEGNNRQDCRWFVPNELMEINK